MPNDETYEKLTYACARTTPPNPDKAEMLLQQMYSGIIFISSHALTTLESLLPSMGTYTNTLNACVRTGDMNRAFKLLADIKSRGIIPDTVLFTTLLRGYVLKNDYTRAWNFFNYARTRGLMQPDEVSYNIMIDSCAKVSTFGVYILLCSKHVLSRQPSY